jgi:hypothetical protein
LTSITIPSVTIIEGEVFSSRTQIIRR